MQRKPDFEIRSSNTEFSGKGSFTDEVLWSIFKKGNDLALSMLYKKYIQRLYNYGMHECHDHDLVMDCLQELFSRLWSKRENLGSIHYIKPYLFKSFRRFLIQQIIEGKKKSTVSAEKTLAFEFMPSIESVLIDEEIRIEQTQRLRKCIQTLTKGQREVIYLKFYNELSYQEIAEITELQIDSVYNLVSKTIELLRKKLQIAKPHLPVF